MKIVAVVGDHEHEHDDLSKPLGEWLALKGVHLLTGGGGGVMTAVSRAFVHTPKRRGVVLGVLPPGKPGYPNPWVEVPIRTHLHGKIDDKGTGKEDPKGIFSRNHINVLTADVVIGLPGGKGTFAEMELAKHYHKHCCAFIGPNSSIAGLNAEALEKLDFKVLPNMTELQIIVNEYLTD